MGKSSPPTTTQNSRVIVEPDSGFMLGQSSTMAPTLRLRGVDPTDLASLAIFLNGREVAARLAAGSTISGDDEVRVELPQMRFSSGVHHLRATVETAGGREVALGESFYEVGDGTQLPSVVIPETGELFTPPQPGEPFEGENDDPTPEGGGHGKGCCCCCCCHKGHGGGGGGGNNGNGNGGNNGNGQGDGDEGQPQGSPGKDKGMPPGPNDCKIVGVRIAPGPIVGARIEFARIFIRTEPADATVLFSKDIAVSFISVNKFLLNGDSLSQVTRARMSRRGVQIVPTIKLGAGFFNVRGPRTVDLLVSQIDDLLRGATDLSSMTFGNAGLVTAITVGAKCAGKGRRARVTVRVRDPREGDEAPDDDLEDSMIGSGSP